MNYFELHIGDYLKKTFGLSSLEHGIYFRLLLYYYGEELPLPSDLVAIYALCSSTSTKERQAVDRIISRYFVTGPDGLRHNRKADEVIGSAKRRIEAAKENGKKGGYRTHRVHSGSDSGSTEIVTPQSPVPSNQSPDTKHQGREREARPQTLDQVLALFRERGYPEAEAPKFWNYYEANGWRVGRNPMKDWKAAAAGWVSRSKEFQPIKTYGKPKSPSVTDSVTSITALTPDLEAIERDHRARHSGG